MAGWMDGSVEGWKEVGQLASQMVFWVTNPINASPNNDKKDQSYCITGKLKA